MSNDLIIKEHKMAIRVDEENNLLYAFGLDLDNNVDESSEGILRYVNTEIAKKVEENFKIKIIDYGVKATECTTTFSMAKQ